MTASSATTTRESYSYSLEDAVRALTAHRERVQALNAPCPNFPRICLCERACYEVAEVTTR